MSNFLLHSLQTQSDLSIFSPRGGTKRYQSSREREHKELCYQKVWVSCHALVFILIAIETMYLLHHKDQELSQFYNSQSQCCYCAWIARNGTFNHQKAIEYSHCQQTYDAPYNTPSICTLEDHGTPTEYCSNAHQDHHESSSVSTTSTLLFIPFPKSYFYYGILCLVLVSIYALTILITTFKYRMHLSSLLFMGNILIAIQCYYNYIKAYQYNKTNYSADAVCSNTPLPDPSSYEQACYQNAVGASVSTLLRVMVSFFEIYFLYPMVFCLFWCINKRCSGGDRVAVIQSYMERALLCIGVMGGFLSIVLCFVVLIIVVWSPDFRFLSWVDNRWERYLCIAIGGTLFVASWSVFCLPRCRAKCASRIKARLMPQWKQRIWNSNDVDNFDTILQPPAELMYLETTPKHSMDKTHKKAHSPLLEKC